MNKLLRRLKQLQDVADSQHGHDPRWGAAVAVLENQEMRLAALESSAVPKAAVKDGPKAAESTQAKTAESASHSNT